MEKNVKFLALAAKIFKVLAWVVGAVVGIIVPIAILITGGTPDVPRIAAIGWVIIGLFQFLWLMTISCLITVILSLAEKGKGISSL
ncbi:MAG: hypothetical protein JW844_03130 [Candidatus Omnitrophica bacterium]|nr:hypothetical protein [Candidatus Omnitrophota bacterium]